MKLNLMKKIKKKYHKDMNYLYNKFKYINKKNYSFKFNEKFILKNYFQLFFYIFLLKKILNKSSISALNYNLLFYIYNNKFYFYILC